VTDGEKIRGVRITDAQIEAWAEEAAAGFDIEELKHRGRGRPGAGASGRITAEEETP
jgi:hypothetical protein